MAKRTTAPNDEALVRLYQLRPDGFVAARDELAKELRAAGDGDASKTIRGLRKPPVTAWAVNRLSSEEPDALSELFAANDRLRSAMAGSGKQTRERFRAASEERQRLVVRLVERARAIMEAANLPAGRANLDRITSTLMATATDGAGADLVRAGVLDHDLSPAGGFGEALGGSPTASAQPPPPTAKPDPKLEAAERKRQERAERDADQRTARAKEADRVASEAEREAADAEREAERLTKIATARRREADRARRDADRASDQARTAIERLDAVPRPG